MLQFSVAVIRETKIPISRLRSPRPKILKFQFWNQVLEWIFLRLNLVIESETEFICETESKTMDLVETQDQETRYTLLKRSKKASAWTKSSIRLITFLFCHLNISKSHFFVMSLWSFCY